MFFVVAFLFGLCLTVSRELSLRPTSAFLQWLWTPILTVLQWDRRVWREEGQFAVGVEAEAEAEVLLSILFQFDFVEFHWSPRSLRFTAEQAGGMANELNHRDSVPHHIHQRIALVT